MGRGVNDSEVIGASRISDTEQEIIRLSDTSWRMWALPDAESFSAPGHYRFALSHAQGTKPVPVLVSVKEDGPYWGWLAKDDDHPTMIYNHIIGYRICFPYGPEAEEERGHGKTLRLSIEPC